MADLETGGDSPYESMLAYHTGRAKASRDRAAAAQDDLTAHAVVHGFDRDKEYMAQLQAIVDAEEAAATQEEATVTGLQGRHEPGAEYHQGGQDAHAEAFRPA